MLAILYADFAWVFMKLDSSKDIKAVCLILHGLNLKPAKMDDWVSFLNEHGCLGIRMELSGHDGNKDSMKKVTHEKWRDDFNRHVNIAKQEAIKLNVPLYFLGFSLGALMGVDFQSSHMLFKKMVLIAPAIATPWYAKAFRLFHIFGQGIMLPSRSPKNYQANFGTSIAAYEALFYIKNSLEEKGFSMANIDTLVIMDKHDELVPLKKVRKIIDKNRLNKWQLIIVNNQFAYNNFGFRHLLVDEGSVGLKLWQDITKKVLEHFEL